MSLAEPRCPIEKWAEKPSLTFSRETVQQLRDILARSRRLQPWNPETFVQGSYANGTTIEQHSDVDIVIQLPMPFEADLTALDDAGREEFYDRYGTCAYGWEEFRADVLATLARSFFVQNGKKCLYIPDFDSLIRVPADVLVAIRYRRYSAFSGSLGEVYDEGVFFRADGRTPIVNYPKQHRANGRAKDRATGGLFTTIVRVAKNAKRHLPEVDAPSYFVECLLFNVPNDRFRDSAAIAYRAVLDWLVRHTDRLPNMRCQNGIVGMFGRHPEAWSVDAARKLIEELDRQCPAGRQA